MTKRASHPHVKRRAPLAEAATSMVAARVAAFEACTSVLARPDDPALADELHALRIAAKRLRYTLELFAGVLPSDTGDLIEELKGLQDDLGALHDRDVLADLAFDQHQRAVTRERETLAELAHAPGAASERRATFRDWEDLESSPRGLLPGLAGLLIDTVDERRATAAKLGARWERLRAARFSERLAALATRESGNHDQTVDHR